MITYNKSDVLSVELCTENCEYIVIPADCFEELKIIELNNKEFEIECIITNKGVKFGGSIDKSQPYEYSKCAISRICQYNDIDYIKIQLNDNEGKVEGSIVWRDREDDCNDYQQSKMFDYNKISLSIKKSNYRISLKDALELPHGSVILDDNENEYTVVEKDGEKYLSDTYISLSLINSTFIQKTN